MEFDFWQMPDLEIVFHPGLLCVLGVLGISLQFFLVFGQNLLL